MRITLNTNFRNRAIMIHNGRPEASGWSFVGSKEPHDGLGTC